MSGTQRGGSAPDTQGGIKLEDSHGVLDLGPGHQNYRLKNNWHTATCTIRGRICPKVKSVNPCHTSRVKYLDTGGEGIKGLTLGTSDGGGGHTSQVWRVSAP